MQECQCLAVRIGRWALGVEEKRGMGMDGLGWDGLVVQVDHVRKGTRTRTRTQRQQQSAKGQSQSQKRKPKRKPKPRQEISGRVGGETDVLDETQTQAQTQTQTNKGEEKSSSSCATRGTSTESQEEGGHGTVQCIVRARC
ncbi:hypothetical protein CALCODRAFT_227659 [Calocera cornea HHB12733]|uniref:Uncharacterized protein n=1 Tax=Calocera cornea HHB12733 TaxID=1353952 RepID=A0A165H2F1_9BASI|nr:hypothetical protein CALCODRAFT_227659 [Calocera cornea HHB12733]